MARPRNPVPRYLHHKPSGQARVCFGDREVYLGAYNSPESLEAYRKLIAELRAAPSEVVVPVLKPAGGATVNEVMLAFWNHAEQHYRRDDGTPTNVITEYRQAFKILRELYGRSPATDFGPLALKAVRQWMIDNGNCRTTINNRVRRLKHRFKWVAENELVPASVHLNLASVAGLQKGRTKVREPEPV